MPERDNGPLAVLGATGYTGALAVASARAAGLPVRLVGRRREALERLALPGEEIRVTDARDATGLAKAFTGACAVASLAGPFAGVGFAPVEAAIEARVHYLDVSGEQGFCRTIYARYGRPAERRGVVLLTAFGFDFVPGDLAARLAGEGLEPLDEVAVAYAVSAAAASRGTKRTIGTLTGRPAAFYRDGALVPSRFAATSRRFRFPFGERDAVEWGGGEPLTVPRHTDVREVRSYVRAPRLASKAAPLGRLVRPLFRLSAAVGPAGPSEERRRAMRFAVVAEARGPRGGRRATVAGEDPYGLTALLLVRAAESLRAGEFEKAGALAPAEAFDARVLLERCDPLMRLGALEELEDS